MPVKKSCHEESTDQWKEPALRQDYLEALHSGFFGQYELTGPLPATVLLSHVLNESLDFFESATIVQFASVYWFNRDSYVIFSVNPAFSLRYSSICL